jgi:hypothetical protein
MIARPRGRSRSFLEVLVRRKPRFASRVPSVLDIGRVGVWAINWLETSLECVILVSVGQRACARLSLEARAALVDTSSF